MRVLLKLATLVISVVLVVAPAGQAEIPHLMAWQGVALDSLNQPLADGFYLFNFSIWNADVGGDSLWGEGQVIEVQQGVLNVLLGSDSFLPDSLFNEPERWLQVQFEGESPYFPRTRIVTVGYAFRVERLQGAMGGEVRSDILLKSPWYSPSVQVLGAGTDAAVAALWGDLLGGYFALADPAGAPFFQVIPDDAGGGELTLLTNEFQTSGVMAYNDGADSPNLLATGVSGVLFAMGLTDDSSVQLPVNAISDPEILDEPGIAASSSVMGSYLITTSFSTIAEVTATFPDRGFVVVICEATFRADTINTWLTGHLVENSSLVGNWYWDPGDVDGNYDQQQTHVHTDSVAAGTYTYELQVSQSVGSCRAINSKVTVLYFPTAYGTVARAVATAGGTDPNMMVVQGHSEPTTSPRIDVAAERAASIEYNEARIRRELEEMKARLELLEATLQARGDALRADR
jgi:hypothetical protein